VRIAALDVSDSTQLSNLAARFKPGELRGVIHTAAAFDRTLLKDLSASALHDVLRPKVHGSWALHEWTRSLTLDFFVLFSSTTSLLGSQTFGAYAAANQFMDALAHYRRAAGLPAVSINWGTWEQMGDTPEEDRKAYLLGGIHPMSSAQALDGLDSALGGDESQTIVANIDWSVLKPLYEARRARPLLSHLSTVVPPARTVRPAEPADLITQLADASQEARERIVVDAVRSHAAAVLGVKPAEVSVNFGLFEMGMDSLMSVELKARLEKCTGRSLPSTLTFNYPNVGALSSYILRLLTESLPRVPENPPRGVQSTITSATKSPREEEELSEDELAAKLAEALRTI
jgi:acyl carrier protein